jgi:TetR/AcrR family transcriptional regulator
VIRPNSELLALLVRRGVERGEFRPVDIDAAVHVWMAPLVMKAIFSHSIDPCCPPEHRIADERFLATHVGLVLASLAKLR